MSYGFGGKIGIMGQVVDGLTLGATYQTVLSMSAFDKYKGLFAEGGKFDVPANWTAGLAYSTGKMTFAFDVKQILYSKVKSVGNIMLLPTNPDGTPNLNFKLLGDNEGSGFGWKDMTIFKVGAQYGVCETMDLRAGFSHGNNPVQESEVMFNILAPAVIENHVTLGFTKRFGKKELDIAIVRALNNALTGKNQMDPAQNITIEMNQWELEIGFSF
jgi:long-chain fatty acid transport protein